jgi:hypothetical protein
MISTTLVMIREMTRYTKVMMIILACQLVTREYLSFTMTHPMMSTTLNFSIRDGSNGAKKRRVNRPMSFLNGAYLCFGAAA